MKTMWLFVCYSSNLKAVFDSHKKANAFKKKWLHEAIENDWLMEEGEDYGLYEIAMNPKNIEKFYSQDK